MITENQRFEIWKDGNFLGEYICREGLKLDGEPILDEYSIYEIKKHFDDDGNVDYENTNILYKWFFENHTFLQDNKEDVVEFLKKGKDGSIKNHYIKFLEPSEIKYRFKYPRFKECKEIWTNEKNWKEDVLKKIGEVDYNIVKMAIENNDDVLYRYIEECYYDDSIFKSADRIRYQQVFVNGNSIGYCEKIPNCKRTNTLVVWIKRSDR